MARIETFSYASETQGSAQRLLIRAIERMTGQPRLKRLYLSNRANPVPGESFWEAALRLLRLEVSIRSGSLETIPATGPVVVVANHPFGVLDGIAISWLMSRRRSDFRVLTNAVLHRAEEIKPWLLPIDFANTKQALQTNLSTRKAAESLLAQGGALVVFPGGTVSYAPSPVSRQAADPEWKPFTAKLIERHKPPVIPVYFEGQNSRLFQIASHVSMSLRLSLLFREVSRRMGGVVPVRIGDPVDYAELEAVGGRREMMDFLRRRTYGLGLDAAKIPAVPPLPRSFRRKEKDKE